MLYVLDTPIPPLIPNDDSRTQWLTHHKDSEKVQYLILSSISDEYLENFRSEIEYLSAYDMVEWLKGKFQQRRNWCLAITKEISKPMKFKYDVGDHMDRMKAYFNRLEKLDNPMSASLAIDMILDTLLS